MRHKCIQVNCKVMIRQVVLTFFETLCRTTLFLDAALFRSGTYSFVVLRSPIAASRNHFRSDPANTTMYCTYHFNVLLAAELIVQLRDAKSDMDPLRGLALISRSVDVGVTRLGSHIHGVLCRASPFARTKPDVLASAPCRAMSEFLEAM